MGRISGLLRDQSGRLRTAWRIVIFMAALGLAWLAVSVGVGMLVGMYVLAKHGMMNSDRLAEHMKAMSGPLLCIVTWPMALVSFIVVWLCRWHLDRRTMLSLGLGRPERRATASPWVGLAVGGAPILLAACGLLVAGRLRFEGANWPWVNVPLVPALLVGAFQEELVCRGYLLRNLLEARRPVLGVTFTAAVFWALHSFNTEVWSSPLPALNLFLAGVMFALAYMVSGNLWFPTAMHFAWNTLQGPIFGINVSGMLMEGWLPVAPVEGASPALTGGGFGLEGSVLVTLMLAAGCVAFLGLLASRGGMGKELCAVEELEISS